MRKAELVTKINALIEQRDNFGADNQGQIDDLFAKFEALPEVVAGNAADADADAYNAAHAAAFFN